MHFRKFVNLICYGMVKFLSNSCYDINHFILHWLWKNSHNLTTKLDGLWVNISTWFLHSIFHKDKIIQHNMQKLQNQKLFWKEKSYNVPSRVSSSYIDNSFSENKQNLTCANFIKYERGNIKLGIQVFRLHYHLRGILKRCNVN